MKTLLIHPYSVGKKLTKKTILAILALVVIGAPLLYLTVLNQKETKAAWFDETYADRKVI